MTTDTEAAQIAPTAKAAQARPRRCWHQFSLRALLIGMALISVLLAVGRAVAASAGGGEDGGISRRQRRILWINCTHVTEAGQANLQEVLPKCRN